MSGANILVVDDEADIRSLIKEILADEGYGVQTAADAAEARERFQSGNPDLVLLDIWMPDTDGISLLDEWSKSGQLNCPVVIMSGHGTVETAVEATRLGAADFIEKPLSLTKLLRTVEKTLQNETIAAAGKSRVRLPPSWVPVGKSPRIVALRQQAEGIAPHSAPVMIIGESGSGREVVARYIHSVSARQQSPFVTASGASMTAENSATMLLGAESSDGPTESGYFGQANGGTLFIDEFGDLCPEGQRLLQGVLDQGGFAPLGRAQVIPLNIRLIVSIRPEEFFGAESHGIRADLLSQLSVLKLQVPALREYPEDVPELLRHFVEKFVDNNALPYRRFSVAAQNRLRNYPWPGNISELASLVQRLLIANGPEEISLEELERELAPSANDDVSLLKKDLLSLPLREAREQFERAYLTQQLEICGGKVGQLAKRVGMERTHLYRKLRALGVDFRQSDRQNGG
jgi:two-component system nitrogen regulation response regulator NtrX